MKKQYVTSTALLLLLFCFCPVSAQKDVTVITPTSEAAEGLDLQAVGELFKDSKDLEEFEKKLNDSETGINNLDLDENSEVDFIRVVEDISDDTHVIILQVPLGEKEFQDVATIEVEKTNGDSYNMQVHGNEVIYGTNYYVAPAVVHIHTWPIIPWIYRPVYRPYRSAFYFGHYPHWWKVRHPVTVNVYRTHTVRFRTKTFAVTKTGRVKSFNKVNYRPHSSTLVKKKTTITKTKGKTTIKRTTVKKRK